MQKEWKMVHKKVCIAQIHRLINGFLNLLWYTYNLFERVLCTYFLINYVSNKPSVLRMDSLTHRIHCQPVHLLSLDFTIYLIYIRLTLPFYLLYLDFTIQYFRTRISLTFLNWIYLSNNHIVTLLSQPFDLCEL
jgi:hypothetical protein